MAFFSFDSWLKKMRASLFGTRRNKPRSAVRTIRSTRLNLELLEDRVTPSSDYANLMLSNNPLAYWQFNEGSGTTAINSGSLGTSYNGTLNGSPTYSTNVPSPQLGDSLSFGSGEDVSAPLVTSSRGPVTMTAWVHQTSNSGTQVIFYNGNTSTSGYGLFVASGSLNFLAGGVADVSTGYTMPLNTWTFVALEVNGASDQVYVNGVQRLTSNVSANAPTTGTFIGSSNSNGQNFNGQIDDPALFSSQLSQTTLSTMYSAGLDTNPPAITTSSLPAGTAGTPYSQTVATSGGTGALTFTISSGSLPIGLALNSSTGVISGTPTSLGAYNVAVRATDADGDPAAQAYAVTINTPTLYWDPGHTDSGTGSGGSGTWDTSTTNWFNGTSDIAWNNSYDATAVFAGSAGTVTLGTGITASALSFSTTGYTVTSNTLTLAGGTGSISVASADSETISTVVAGSTGLTLSGGGTLVLSGADTYSGATTINAGTLGVDGSITSAVTVNSGGTLTGGGTINANVTNNGGTVSTAYSGADVLADKPTPSYYQLAETSGTTAVDSSGNNPNGTYQGGYTLNQPGPVPGVPAVALNGTSGTVSVPAGAVNNLTSGTIAAWVYLNANTGETIFAKQHNAVNSYAIFTIGYLPTGSPNPGTAGTLYFHADNATATAASTGTVSTGAWHYVAVAFSSTAATFYIDGVASGTTSGANYSIPNDLSPTSTNIGAWVENGNPDLYALNGSIAQFAVFGTALSAAQISALYHGTLTVAGTYTQSSGTTSLSGTLAVSGAATFNGGSLSGAGTFADNGSLTFNSSGSFTVTPVISGSGSLLQSGTGMTTLTAANTYAGPTTVTGGTLSISADDNLGADPSSATAGNIVLNGGTLQATAGFSLNSNRGIALGPTSGSGGGTFDVTSGNTLTYGGIVANNGSGSGSLTMTDSGTLTLSGANTYKGGTTISAGTLSLVNEPLPSGTAAIASGATLQYADTSNVNQAGLTLTGAGTLQKIGTGTLTFGGSAAVNWNLSGGALIDVEGGTLVGGNNVEDFWTNDLASLNIAAGATFSGVEANVMVDALTGSGTLESGYPSHGYSTFTIGVNNGSGTFSGVIADNTSGENSPANITKAATGTEVFAGTNTYSGTTTISGGTLEVDGSLAAGSGVTVQSGGTLDGTGTVNGSVTVQSGGIVSPGDTPGILNTGSVTFNSGSSFDVALNGTTVGTQYAQLNAAGTVSLGNASLDATLGFTSAYGTVFTIVSATSVSGTFNGLANNSTFVVNGRSLRVNYTATTVTLTDVTSPAVTGLANQTATEGAAQSFNLGSFSEPSGGPWTVTVSWGDNSSNTTFTATSAGSLGTQSHTYAEEGAYTVKVTVTDSSNVPGSASIQTTVADALLTAGTVSASGGIEGVNPTTLSAAFTDANVNAPTSDFSGTINWGDGTALNPDVTSFDSSAVSGGSGSYSVGSSHLYAEEGNYTISVTVNDVGGASLGGTGALTLYATQDSSGKQVGGATFVSIDPTTGVATTIGTLSERTSEGLAYDPSSSTMYVAEQSGLVTKQGVQTSLYSVNLSDGTDTPIGDVVAGAGKSGVEVNVQDLAFDSNNDTLYAVDDTGLWSIDPSTGAATLVATLDKFVNSVAIDSATNTFYGEDNNGDLYTIDPGSGTTTLVGTANDVLKGLAFNPLNGQLYSTHGTTLVTIDPTTGLDTVVGGPEQKASYGGLAFAPPETTTVVVNDAALTAGTVSASGGVAGVTPTTLSATFTDANVNAPASDFSGTISWGDGNPVTNFDASDVTANGNGSFTVNASYQYAEESGATPYNITVTINDVGGSTTTDSGSTTVADAPLTAGALTPPTGTRTPTVSTLVGLSGGASGLAFDSAGNLFAIGGNTVYKVTANGAVVSTFPTSVSIPFGMAIDSSGNIYIADLGGNTISEYTSPGTLINGSFISGVDGNRDVAFDASGNIYVDTGDTVSEYTSAGALINAAFATGLSNPHQLAFDNSGNLYIANYGGDVDKVTPDGTVSTFISSGLLQGAFGVAIDNKTGDVYVSNYDGGTVSQFSSSGTLLNADYVSGLSQPNFMAFDSSGNLLIANQQNITKVGLPPAVEDQAFTNETVFHFTDADPNGTATDYTGVVALGDGNSVTLNSSGVVSGPAGASGQIVADVNGGFDVQLSYTYSEELTNATFSVTVTDVGGSTASASISTFNVADAPLTAGTVSASGGVAGVTPTTFSATFTDTDVNAPASDFSGTINWGDGNAATPFTSADVTANGNGSFTVNASYQYAEGSGATPYNITVTINDAGGSTTDTGTTTVIAAPTLSSAPSATSVTLGTTAPTLIDTATLSGGYNETGTITFTLYDPNGTLVDTEYVTTVSGDGSYTTPAGYTLSINVTVTGTYQWDASYPGDPNNIPASDINDPAGQVTVSPAQPTLTTTPSAINITLDDTGAPTLRDSATLNGAYFPTGTVTFYLFAPGVTSAADYSNAVYSETDPVSGGMAGTATGYTLPTKVTVTGTYQWLAMYSGDGNNNSVLPGRQRAYYELNETSGTTADDSSGNGENGTYQGGYTLGVPGPFAGLTAVSLDGTSGNVNVPATTVNNLSSGTIAAWVYLNANNDETIFAKQHNGVNSDAIFTVGYNYYSGGSGTAGTLYFQADNQSGFAANTGTVSTGAWHYVAVVFSSTAATFYIDGVARGTTSGNYSIPDDTSPTSTNIGAWLGDGGGHYLNGSIAQFAVFGTALTASQIAAFELAQPTGESVTVSPASPTVSVSSGQTAALVGTTTTLTASAVLAGGYYETGSLTFTLYDANGLLVDTETAAVTGNGTYTTPTGYSLPNTAPAGAYQWDASYNSDGNNNPASDLLDPNARVAVLMATPANATIVSVIGDLGGQIASLPGGSTSPLGIELGNDLIQASNDLAVGDIAGVNSALATFDSTALTALTTPGSAINSTTDPLTTAEMLLYAATALDYTVNGIPLAPPDVQQAEQADFLQIATTIPGGLTGGDPLVAAFTNIAQQGAVGNFAGLNSALASFDSTALGELSTAGSGVNATADPLTTAETLLYAATALDYTVNGSPLAPPAVQQAEQADFLQIATTIPGGLTGGDPLVAAFTNIAQQGAVGNFAGLNSALATFESTALSELTTPNSPVNLTDAATLLTAATNLYYTVNGIPLAPADVQQAELGDFAQIATTIPGGLTGGDPLVAAFTNIAQQGAVGNFAGLNTALASFDSTALSELAAPGSPVNLTDAATLLTAATNLYYTVNGIPLAPAATQQAELADFAQIATTIPGGLTGGHPLVAAFTNIAQQGAVGNFAGLNSVLAIFDSTVRSELNTPGSGVNLTNATAMLEASTALYYTVNGIPETPTVSVSDTGGTYDGMAVPATATVAGVVSGIDDSPAASLEDVTPSLTYYLLDAAGNKLSQLGGAPVDAGYYEVDAYIAGSTDYTSAAASTTFTITPATLTVTANPQTKVYGQSDPTLTYAVSGLQLHDTAATVLTGSLTRTAGENAAGGPYAISQGTLAADSNYTLAFTGSSLTITPAALTITANNQSKIYGAALPTLTVTYTGLVNGDTPATFSTSPNTAPSVSTTATAASHVAGSPYSITASGAVDSDYTISYAAGKLTITPAALTITANNQTKVYGAALPTLTVTYTGLVNGDTPATFSTSPNTAPSVSTTATAASHVAGSPYTITASGAVDSDYSISYAAGALAVTPAALTITANNQSKVYGAALPTLTVTYTGLVNGDTPATFSTSPNTAPTISTTATAASHVAGSPYSITASGAVDSDYTISYVAGTLTVTAYAFTYQIANDAQNYGTAANLAHDLGTTINTGVNSQNLDIVYSSQGDNATAVVGAYPITGIVSSGTGLLSDYKVTLLPGTLTVTMSVATGNVYLLNSTAPGELTLSGNAQFKLTGVVDIDSNSSSAVTASGNAIVSATGIQVVGKVQTSGNAKLSPAPVTGAGSFTDPLVNLAVPNLSGTASSVNLSGNSTLTINQGIYSQIQVSGNAVLTMNPGVYVIAGGGLNVSGNGIIKGSGVMIYNGGSKYAGGVDGGSYGAITFSGNAQFNATPASSGTYANILSFQGRQNTNTLTFSGNADPNAGSIIYAPTAAVTMSGNSQVGSATFHATLIASTLNLNGNAIFQLSNPSDGTTAFSPDQIRTAYGVNGLSLDGIGQTIAIVDAYDNPNIYPSVDAFDTQFGTTADGLSLFGQYGPASSFLTVLNQDGQAGNLPGTDPSGAGTANWESEESLDVEWAHAMAPGARIILVEANSQSLPDLMAAVATAAAQPGVSVVSMSWGFPESTAGLASAEAQYDSYFTTPAGHQGVTFMASTGDYGSAVPEYPAFSPNVVAIGGTSLALNANGSYNSETGWGYYSNAVGQFIASGGGVSQYESEPAYQQGVQSTGSRTTPDVSFLADPNTGAWIADTYNLSDSNPWETAGGTSLSAPAWAGLIALVDQGRTAAGEQTLGLAGPTETQTALYNLPQSDYNVIASGSNGAFTAQAGYNLVTGLGTPVANLLVSDLIAWSGAVNTSGNTVPAWQGSSDYQNSGSGNSPNSVASAIVFHVFDFETIRLGPLAIPDAHAVLSLAHGSPSSPAVAADFSTPSVASLPNGLASGPWTIRTEGRAVSVTETPAAIARTSAPMDPIVPALPGPSASLSIFSQRGPLVLDQWSEESFGRLNLPASFDPQGDGHPATPGFDGDDSVLVGGSGNDLLIGSHGRNLMVGGFGMDQVAQDRAADSADAPATPGERGAWPAPTGDSVESNGSTLGDRTAPPTAEADDAATEE